MMEIDKFKIGDIVIGLFSDFPSGDFDDFKCFPAFRSPDQENVILNIHFEKLPEITLDRLVFDSKTVWRLYESQGRNVIHTGPHDQEPFLAGLFSADFHSGEIFTSSIYSSPGKFYFPIGFPMGEIYMTNLLGTGYGVLLHACGVVFKENGYLFAGTGGSGKSTTAQLWERKTGARILNDDRVIVRKNGGGFRLFGTPWHGQGGIALPEAAPLKKIFILKQAPSNQIKPLSPAQAASALLVRSLSPFWNAPGMRFTVQFLSELCQQVPCAEFGFVPDQSAVDFVSSL